MGTLNRLLNGQTMLTARPEQTAMEAAQILATHNIGALPVVAAGKVVGIVSERDIIGRVVASGRDPKTTSVEAIMTKNPVTVDAAQTPVDAIHLMRQHKCRHLPALREGKLLGMISLRDLIEV